MIGDATPCTSGPIYPPGSVHCNGTATAIVDVTNPTTGKTWMDRNLGSSQVASSSEDTSSYGDYYQWGRGSDGHQCRTSVTTPTLSSSDQPGHGNFITSSGSPSDWRSSANINLWQGTGGTNNPCPGGYRLPTDTELEAERVSWSSNDPAGAFASLLKLPMSGSRYQTDGLFYDVGSRGYYWSSTISGAISNKLYIHSTDAYISHSGRADGHSVRCIKD
jgi:uncharacterized protein (TIGR02145 family)